MDVAEHPSFSVKVVLDKAEIPHPRHRKSLLCLRSTLTVHCEHIASNKDTLYVRIKWRHIVIFEATELDEILGQGVDETVRGFIQLYFLRFVERGMSEQDAVKTVTELCDEFFGFWRFYSCED